MGIERQFHSDAPVANLTGDIGDGRSDASILRPWEAFQSQAGVLSRSNATQSRWRIEVRHHPKLACRHHRGQFFAFADHRSDPQWRHFAQLAVDRGAYASAIDLFLKPLNFHAGRRSVAAQFVEFAGELLDVRLSLASARALLSFQTYYAIAQAIGCRPTLLGIGYAAVQV